MSQEEWMEVIRETIEGYKEVIEITMEEKKAIPYVMQSIEILFAAYFLNEGDEECAMGAKDIYEMITSCMVERPAKNGASFN